MILRVDIQARYVPPGFDQLFRRIISMNMGKGRVGAYKTALRAYLENPFHSVLIDIAECFLRSLPFFLYVLEFPDLLAEGFHFFDESLFFLVPISHHGVLTSNVYLKYISLSLEGRDK